MHVKQTISKAGRIIGHSFKRTFWDCPARLLSRFDGDNTERCYLKEQLLDYVSVWTWGSVIAAVAPVIAPIASLYVTAVFVGLAIESFCFGNYIYKPA